MKALLLGLALALAPSAEPPAAPPVPRSFETATEAAVWAFSTIYNRLSPYYEYGGVILQQPNGRYVAALPSTEYAGDHVGIDTDPLEYPKGDIIVATYHTHPCLPVSHIPGQFSPDDLKAAREERYLAYMADLCKGDVHLFDPALDASPSQIDNILAGGAASSGRIVGHFPVSGVSLEAVH